MTNETKAQKLEAQIKSFLHDNLDPADYKLGMAELFSVTVDDVVAAIERVGGERRSVSLEVVARERLAREARDRHQNRAAWREYDHEED